MDGMRRWMAVGAMAMLAAGGCSGAGASDADEREPAASVDASPPNAAPAAPQPPPPPRTAADSARVRAEVAARGDSVRAAFERASALGASEVAELRQDVNAEQIATARKLGVRAGSESRIAQLRRDGVLVELDDSTAYWVLRDMDHSVPIVTPDARGMLTELGRRFHARLDSLGLPRYRIKVTSALRTDETQADLRKTNPYASQIVSAHEFGTTMDISHERFAVPAEMAPTGAPEMEEEVLDSLGKEHSKVLQAELGRAIAEMRDQGALHVMMENLQPVYHMTVRRRFPAGPADR